MRRLDPLAVALLLLLPQVHALGSTPFLRYDDMIWLNQARRHGGVDAVIAPFAGTVFSYRPLVAAYLDAAAGVLGPSASALTRANLALCGIVAALAFIAFRRELGAGVAFAAAALWCLHRAVGDMGTFVSDAGGPLFMGLSLIAIIAHRRWLDDARPMAWLAALAAFTAACLAKEWAVFTLPVLVAMEHARRPPYSAVRLVRYLPHVIIAVAVATQALGASLERSAGDLGAYQAGADLPTRGGQMALFVLLPSGRMNNVVAPYLGAIGGAAMILAAAALARGTTTTRLLVLWSCAWAFPPLPIDPALTPLALRYAAPAALPAMALMAIAALTARRRAVRGMATGAAALLVVASLTPIARSLSGAAPTLTPRATIELRLWSDILGFPANASHLTIAPAQLRAYLGDGEVPRDRFLVVRFLLEGRGRELCGETERARAMYEQARIEAARAGVPDYRHWLGGLLLRPDDVERFVSARLRALATGAEPVAVDAAAPVGEREGMEER